METGSIDWMCLEFCARVIYVGFRTCDCQVQILSNNQIGGNMFEFDHEIVDFLVSENKDFKRLFEKHGELKQRVNDANTGTIPIDNFTLENMKKEKLLLKDRMAHMIEDYRRAHV